MFPSFSTADRLLNVFSSSFPALMPFQFTCRLKPRFASTPSLPSLVVATHTLHVQFPCFVTVLAPSSPAVCTANVLDNSISLCRPLGMYCRMFRRPQRSLYHVCCVVGVPSMTSATFPDTRTSQTLAPPWRVEIIKDTIKEIIEESIDPWPESV